ncbi:MAG: hypothetical protein PVJ73_10940 [Acidobacteriota bacterium]|jgi:hypothetical protein
MVIRRLPAELADVVRRTAHYPHGLGFLHQGWIDSVAVTLGVHPFAIDAVRAYLETAHGRAELIEAVRRERDRDRARPLPHTPRPRTRHDCEERARALIEAAREDTRGLVFLAEGPPEEVAEAYHVHPYLVFRARGILERKAAFEEHGPGVGTPAPR